MKILSFWIFCCKNTTCVVLFMQSTYIISTSEVLHISIHPDDAFARDYNYGMHQSAGRSSILLVYNLEMTAGNKFCTKRKYGHSGYFVAKIQLVWFYSWVAHITQQRLVVAMGGGGKEVWSFKQYLLRKSTKSKCGLPSCAEAYNPPPPWGEGAFK